MAVQKQIGRLLLDYGLVRESAEFFRGLTQITPQDGDAYAGLGRAEFALGDFRSAQQAFRSALRRNPTDDASKKQLELVEQILALDPSLRGLSASERYARSRKLVEAALGSLDRCPATETTPMTPPMTQTVDAARKSVLVSGKTTFLRRRHRSQCCIVRTALENRASTHAARQKLSDEMLSILMARLLSDT